MIKAVTQLYGWADAEPDDSGMVTVYAPYASIEELIDDAVVAYELQEDQEVDIAIGAVRPVRPWDTAMPTADRLLAAMNSAITAVSVRDGAWLDESATVSVGQGRTVEQADLLLRQYLSRWAERALQARGWWLLSPKWYTVCGDGTYQPMKGDDA